MFEGAKGADSSSVICGTVVPPWLYWDWGRDGGNVTVVCVESAMELREWKCG